MVSKRSSSILIGGLGLALGGCVATVPEAPTYTVVPGQGKTEANLRADDAACRGPVAINATIAATTQTPSVTADQYYQCMASRGELVVQQSPRAYPAYAYAAPAYVPYAYPAIAAYPYPYYGYGYGYPYGYFGRYVGVGIGFGTGRFYGGRGYDHGGFRGDYRGEHGFHGGGGYHR